MSTKPRYPLASPPMKAPILTELARGIPTAPPVLQGAKSPQNQVIDTRMVFTDGTGVPARIYSGDRLWAIVTITLQTAGPVAVSPNPSMGTTGSGNGRLLTTNEPVEYTCGEGQSIYVQSTSPNRLALSIQPVPWIEQVVGYQMAGQGADHVMSDQLAALGKLLQQQNQLLAQLAQTLIQRGGK